MDYPDALGRRLRECEELNAAIRKALSLIEDGPLDDRRKDEIRGVLNEPLTVKWEYVSLGDNKAAT